MSWLAIIIIAHLFYALVFIFDKYILSRSLPHPIVYSFYVGVLSIVICALIPFGFYWPSFREFILVLICGAVSVVGNVLFYTALSKDEASRVIPFTGGFVAVFTLILSIFILGEQLNLYQVLAFALLVLGSLIISFEKKKIFSKNFAMAALSALFFAIFWVLTKYIFVGTTFVSGTIWVRMGVVLASLALLIPKKNRELIFKKTEKAKPRTFVIFALGRALSILGGLGIYFAVYLGSVSLTNSLQGLQYAFILLLAFLLYKKYPSLKEEFSREVIIQKIIAVILIVFGLGILVI